MYISLLELINQVLAPKPAIKINSIVPTPDRPRVRPTLVQGAEGEAVIFVEIALTPREVEAMMQSDALLLHNTAVMAGDARQAVYDFVRRTRATYFEGRS